MEAVNLTRILPIELKEQIDSFVFEYVGGKEYEILYGKVFIPEANAITDEIIIDAVIKTVCESFRVHRKDVLSKTRRMPFLIYRQYITYFLGQYLNISLSEIGAIVDRDHATVIHTNKVVEDYIRTDRHRREEIKQIENILSVILWENK